MKCIAVDFRGFTKDLEGDQRPRRWRRPRSKNGRNPVAITRRAAREP